jgi:hypothetical protein
MRWRGRRDPAAQARPRRSCGARAARTAARRAHQHRPRPANGSRSVPAARPLGQDGEGSHGRGELVGLGEHPARLRLVDPHAVGPGPAADGESEAVDGAGTHAALLDAELRERRREDARVMGGVVSEQAVDALGWSVDPTLRRHMSLGHTPILPRRARSCRAVRAGMGGIGARPGHASTQPLGSRRAATDRRRNQHDRWRSLTEGGSTRAPLPASTCGSAIIRHGLLSVGHTSR